MVQLILEIWERYLKILESWKPILCLSFILEGSRRFTEILRNSCHVSIILEVEHVTKILRLLEVLEFSERNESRWIDLCFGGLRQS